MTSLFARKPIADLIAEEGHPNSLKRSLGAGDLIMLAIGAVIGAGIFGSIGSAAAGQLGPERRGHPRRCRTRARRLVPPARRLLRPRGALLRRAGVDDPAGRERVRVLVRDARRGRRVDHRVGPDPRVRRRQCRRRDLVGRLLQIARRRPSLLPAARTRIRIRRDHDAGLAHHGLPYGTAQLRIPRFTDCSQPRRAWPVFRC